MVATATTARDATAATAGSPIPGSLSPLPVQNRGEHGGMADLPEPSQSTPGGPHEAPGEAPQTPPRSPARPPEGAWKKLTPNTFLLSPASTRTPDPKPDWRDKQLDRLLGPAPKVAAALPVLADAISPNDGSVPQEEAGILRDLLASAHTANTKRAYKRNWRDYEAWCRLRQLTPCPAPYQTIASYLAHLFGEKGAAMNSIRQALSTISEAHRLAGIKDVRQHELVRKTLEGIKRSSKEVRGKDALVLEDLERLLKVTPKDVAGCRDRAIMLLGFATASRCSEIVALDLDTLTFVDEENAKGLVVLVYRIKNKKFQDVAIPFSSRPEICPVVALVHWLRRLEKAGVLEGPIFRPTSGETILEGRLCSKQVARIVKKYAKEAGLPNVDSLSSHSLKIGFMTEGSNRGLTADELVRQSGHASLVVAQGYIKRRDFKTLFANHPLRKIL